MNVGFFPVYQYIDLSTKRATKKRLSRVVAAFVVARSQIGYHSLSKVYAFVANNTHVLTHATKKHLPSNSILVGLDWGVTKKHLSRYIKLVIILSHKACSTCPGSAWVSFWCSKDLKEGMQSNSATTKSKL